MGAEIMLPTKMETTGYWQLLVIPILDMFVNMVRMVLLVLIFLGIITFFFTNSLFNPSYGLVVD